MQRKTIRDIAQRGGRGKFVLGRVGTEVAFDAAAGPGSTKFLADIELPAIAIRFWR